MTLVEITTDKNGNFIVEIPDDVLDSIGWEEGDCVEWSLRGDALVLSRIGEGAEIIEESIY